MVQLDSLATLLEKLMVKVEKADNPEPYAIAMSTLTNTYLQLREDERRQLLVEMSRFAEVFNTINILVEPSLIKGGADKFYLPKDKAEQLLAAVNEIKKKIYSLNAIR